MPHRHILIAAAALVAVSFVSLLIPLFYGVADAQILIQRTVRLVIAGALAYGLVKGLNWVRWTTVVLCILGFVVSAATLPRILNGWSEVPFLLRFWTPALVLIFAAVSSFLAFSPTAKAHFEAPRRA
ncbi:MAG: hypothetical protein ACOC3I_07305 [Verrucomicrobiota bacterium]